MKKREEKGTMWLRMRRLKEIYQPRKRRGYDPRLEEAMTYEIPVLTGEYREEPWVKKLMGKIRLDAEVKRL